MASFSSDSMGSVRFIILSVSASVWSSILRWSRIALNLVYVTPFVPPTIFNLGYTIHNPNIAKGFAGVFF